MADRETHEYLSKKAFGDKCTPVHRFLDSKFPKYFHRHRFYYHHWEGIDECVNSVKQIMDYDLARMAAIQHVELDFEVQGHQLPIPHRKDYAGGEGDWPVGKDWGNNMKPWGTKCSDKTFGIDDKHIKMVIRDIEKRCGEVT